MNVPNEADGQVPALGRPKPEHAPSGGGDPRAASPTLARGAAGKTGGKLSLHRQLLWWLLAPQLILWLMGGVLAYRVALSYAEKALDASLSQSVLALSRQVKPLGSGLLVDFPKAAQAIMEQDPSDRVAYMVSSPPGSFFLGNLKLPAPPDALQIPDNTPVFYDQEVDGKALRVALMELNYGTPPADQRMRVQVAKSLAAKQVLARELVRDVLVPLLLLGTILSVLVYGGIRRGLAPLQRLETQLAHRSTAALTPIELTEAPQEVHSLATTINELLGTLRRSLSQEKRFLNDAAHQLRTPLAGLISQSELAMQETDPQALRERLQKVNLGAQRSAHLVGQLLSLARTEAAIEMQNVDVSALARDVARECTRKAVNCGIDLGWEGDEVLTIPAGRVLLREALSNLIDNALRYAGKGATVTVTSRRDGDLCVLGVEDNGPGLRADQLAHVFERFWRASELPGGCGLGLAIVAEIAHRHAGEAVALPVSPHGLRVELRLPLR